MKLKSLQLIFTAILLCTATTFANVQINATNFPCENFRAWLLEQSWGSKGYITDAEIENITSINVSIRNISDLTGIQFFTYLQRLVCERNQLTSLDVSGLNNLVWLFCGWNQLTSLDLSGLDNLRDLSCSNNQLTSLDVSGLTNLLTLNCFGNQLTSLDLSGLYNIELLSLGNNKLTSLDLTGFDRLTTFFGNSQQNPTLTLTGANDNYSLEIDLNNPTELVSGLSYFDGTLTSTSNTITTSPFAVETGNPNFILSGTLTLNYETETSIREIKNANRQAVVFFTITGVKLHTEPQSGIFIILYDDGTSEKVMR